MDFLEGKPAVNPAPSPAWTKKLLNYFEYALLMAEWINWIDQNFFTLFNAVGYLSSLTCRCHGVPWWCWSRWFPCWSHCQSGECVSSAGKSTPLRISSVWPPGREYWIMRTEDIVQIVHTDVPCLGWSPCTRRWRRWGSPWAGWGSRWSWGGARWCRSRAPPCGCGLSEGGSGNTRISRRCPSRWTVCCRGPAAPSRRCWPCRCCCCTERRQPSEFCLWSPELSGLSDWIYKWSFPYIWVKSWARPQQPREQRRETTGWEIDDIN